MNRTLVLMIPLFALVTLSFTNIAVAEDCRQCTTEFDKCKAKKGADLPKCLRADTECTKANDKLGCVAAGEASSCPKSNAEDCRQCTTEFDQCMKKKNADEADCLKKNACCTQDNDKMGCG